jgi:threonine dehydrogenase-like Zn-dependent dehydrogenase
MDHSGSGNPLGFVTEASRKVPVVHEPDVLVIGAGPAGIGAAAARSLLSAGGP